MRDPSVACGRNAPGRAPERSRPTSTKSLKCPAWSEASWRLSEKLSSFRAVGGSSASARSWRDRGQSENRRRRASPAGTERAQLAEVCDLPRAIGDPAAQAEPERRRHEVARQAGRRPNFRLGVTVTGVGSRARRLCLTIPSPDQANRRGPRLRTSSSSRSATGSRSRSTRSSRFARPRRRCGPRSPGSPRSARPSSSRSRTGTYSCPHSRQNASGISTLAIPGDVQLPSRADVAALPRRRATR